MTTPQNIGTTSDTHKPFVRISWKEAFEELKSVLHDKYGAKGEVMLMKDYGYDGIGEHYDDPTFVDVYLREK